MAKIIRNVSSVLAKVDLDGLADGMILDADGDTTLSSPTDDQIDIEVGGSDVALWDANGLEFEDDISAIFGTGGDTELIWSTGDADNHALVLALGNTSQALHVTDLGAVATDWNISGTTHPNVYIHSNTTPATDYLRLGGHTGTAADIDVVGGTTLNFQIGGTSAVDMTATVLNVLDGGIFWVGAEATPAGNAGINWIGIEDGADDPAGTLTNALAIYTPDGGDSLDFLHADGTTDSLGT